ncbi:hypothetical protein F5Y18DRAFT_401216 [Xylariaceae sp. FL1019]|nr:hypothetical protein F5Y18DRAFT_401216 [Xylariaceae sp. FL1019]
MCLRVYEAAKTLFMPLLLDNLLEEIARCLPMFKNAIHDGKYKESHLDYLLGYAQMCNRLAQEILDRDQAACYEPILRLMAHWFWTHERWTGFMASQARIVQTFGGMDFMRLSYSNDGSSALSSRDLGEQSSGVLSSVSGLKSEHEPAKASTRRVAPQASEQSHRTSSDDLKMGGLLITPYGTQGHLTTVTPSFMETKHVYQDRYGYRVFRTVNDPSC